MTTREYVEKVASQVNGTVIEVPKANGVIKTAVRLDIGTNIYPVAYVDDMKKSGLTVEQAVEECEKIKQRKFDVNVDTLSDYTSIKDKLHLRLYNAKTPAEVYWLADRYGFEDLIIVPYLIIKQNIDEVQATKVSENLLNTWGISRKQLFEDAWEATEKEIVELNFLGMHGITNSTKSFGAIGCIFKADELKKKYPNGYFIVPSSIHEVLIIDKTTGLCKEEVDTMVREVNEAELKPEEVLSNHAYEF